MLSLKRLRTFFSLTWSTSKDRVAAHECDSRPSSVGRAETLRLGVQRDRELVDYRTCIFLGIRTCGLHQMWFDCWLFDFFLEKGVACIDSSYFSSGNVRILSWGAAVISRNVRNESSTWRYCKTLKGRQIVLKMVHVVIEPEFLWICGTITAVFSELQ